MQSPAVQHALQGHPESGHLWEEHGIKILSDPALDFHSTSCGPHCTASMTGGQVPHLVQTQNCCQENTSFHWQEITTA